MRTAAACLLSLAILALSGLSGASAHHSYVTKYDPARMVTIKGKVISVSFRNPHIFFSIMVKNRGGGESEWLIETESVQMVRARGLTRAKLKIGSTVTLTGWRARSGAAEVGLARIKPAGSHWISIRTRPR